MDQLTETVAPPTAYSSVSSQPMIQATEFAHGRVGVGVGAARDGNHGGELAVAHAREGATESGDHEGKDDGRSGVVVGGDGGDGEQARADDGADAQSDQVDRAQRTLELVRAAFAFANDTGQRLNGKQIHGWWLSFSKSAG